MAADEGDAAEFDPWADDVSSEHKAHEEHPGGALLDQHKARPRRWKLLRNPVEDVLAMLKPGSKSLIHVASEHHSSEVMCAASEHIQDAVHGLFSRGNTAPASPKEIPPPQQAAGAGAAAAADTGTGSSKEEAAELDAAATKIQAVQRGKNSRKGKATAADTGTGSSKEEAAELDAAATKIQAVQRGKNSRSKEGKGGGPLVASGQTLKDLNSEATLARRPPPHGPRATTPTLAQLESEAAQMDYYRGTRKPNIPSALYQQHQLPIGRQGSHLPVPLQERPMSRISPTSPTSTFSQTQQPESRNNPSGGGGGGGGGGSPVRIESLARTAPAAAGSPNVTISASRMLSLTHVLTLLESQGGPPPVFCLPEHEHWVAPGGEKQSFPKPFPKDLSAADETHALPTCERSRVPGHHHFDIALSAACTHLARGLIGSYSLKEALASGSEGYVKKNHPMCKCPGKPLMPAEARAILKVWGQEMTEQQDWAAAAVHSGAADFVVEAAQACVQCVYDSNLSERWDVVYRLAIRDMGPEAPPVGVWIVELAGDSLSSEKKKELFSGRMRGFTRSCKATPTAGSKAGGL